MRMIPQRHDDSRIGLLGGSFNPPHDGHREISLAAIERLKLDAVWWLVSPGNPLKDPGAYAPYEERLALARRVSSHPRIVVSDFENRKNLQYTVDTLATLEALWPQLRFVWLMGADALLEFGRWKDWRAIFAMVPIAIFARPGSAAPLKSEAARAFAPFRIDPEDAGDLAGAEPPAWVYFQDTRNPASSTALRARAAPRPTGKD
jgi:nicotinate-nucleotide adenylyltransferase